MVCINLSYTEDSFFLMPNFQVPKIPFSSGPEVLQLLHCFNLKGMSRAEVEGSFMT